jgi:hypothetical protein
MYKNGKMRLVEIIPRMRTGGITETKTPKYSLV